MSAASIGTNADMFSHPVSVISSMSSSRSPRCKSSIFRKHESFHRRELDHYSALSKEARAATNSFLTAVLERVETAEAGRRFGKRRTREQQEESGSQANMG